MTGPLLSNGGVLYSVPIQPAPGSLPNPTARELASGPPQRSGLQPAEPGHGQGVHYWNISYSSDDIKHLCVSGIFQVRLVTDNLCKDICALVEYFRLV